MKPAEYGIEKNVKLIAISGAILLLTLIGALIVVQRSLGASQASLSDMVIPTQRELSELSSNVGSLYLRQNEMVAANGEALNQLRDRQAYEQALFETQKNLDHLFTSTGLDKHPDFPHESVEEMYQDVATFLEVDDELLAAVSLHHELLEQFQDSIIAIDAELRQLTEASSGVAGVLRLNHISQLRQIDRDIHAEAIDLEAVHLAINGDARVQLSAIDELDDAVLHLGVLAGKVGLAESNDALNSLSANHLVQNKHQTSQALLKIERLIKDEDLAKRIVLIRELVSSLESSVSDESNPSSLASLRRRILAQETKVSSIQRRATDTATRLNEHALALRSFSQDVAQRAQSSASRTVIMSRWATILASISGVVVLIVAAFRVRTSIRDLRAQNNRLAELTEDLSQVNAGLEETVEQRTASLQRILDNTGDGILSVDLDGNLLPERSRVVQDFFGPAEAEMKFWDYLSGEDDLLRMSLQLAFDQVASQILPFEVAIDQAPSRINFFGRTFHLDYRDVVEHDELVKVLILIRDITSQLEAERVESEVKELHNLIANVLRDRDGFNRTIVECDALLAEVCNSNDTRTINRALHTIKGNCSVIGFSQFASQVHHLESRLLDEERDPLPEERLLLNQAWQTSMLQVKEYLSTDRRYIEIDEDELLQLSKLVRRHGGYEEIHNIVESWWNEPTAAPLHRLASQARHVAKRLHKEVNVVVEHNHLRIPQQPLQSFWATMVHIVRNAIDHGLGDQPRRLAAGKPLVGTLTLATRISAKALEIVVSDDGGGIDWEAISRKAAEMNLPRKTQEDLIEVLFTDGVTSRQTSTEISGRGVGLCAVREACEKAGGTVLVSSVTGEGTSFVFQFPLDQRSLASFHTARPLVGLESN